LLLAVDKIKAKELEILERGGSSVLLSNSIDIPTKTEKNIVLLRLRERVLGTNLGASGAKSFPPPSNISNNASIPLHLAAATAAAATTTSFVSKLGPKLLESIAKDCITNPPRVICIGDVHGCLQELLSLLRKVNYRPCDKILFLGDLVAKGPDSSGVIKLASDFGCIGVRGNHDHEVVKIFQEERDAQKSLFDGVKNTAFRPSESYLKGNQHLQIMLSLSQSSKNFISNLPFYISSPTLNHVFVHAGFVQHVALKDQHIRFMTNMRSILDDGTPTAKFYRDMPWAKTWRGPMTVLFGHDADRGLQKHEFALGLDTGCVYGGELSACILPGGEIVAVEGEREYMLKKRKEHFS